MDIFGFLSLALLLGFPFNILAYLLLQLMPSRRWLVFLSVLFLCVLVFEYYRYISLPFEGRDGLGDMLVVPSFYVVGLSIFLGLTTRLYVLRLKRMGVNPAQTHRVTILGLFLTILLPIF